MKNVVYISIAVMLILQSCKNSDVQLENDSDVHIEMNEVQNELEEILQSVSIEAIKLGDFDYSEETKSNEWLGYPAATTDEISRAEKRLNLKLPEEYLNFLKLSNGFQPTSSIYPTFHSIDKIDFLRNVDRYLVEIWNQPGTEDIGLKMNRSIIVGGINEEQQFLLIPPLKDESWEYWSFASWYPGEVVYPNFKSFWLEVEEFLKENSKN